MLLTIHIKELPMQQFNFSEHPRRAAVPNTDCNALVAAVDNAIREMQTHQHIASYMLRCGKTQAYIVRAGAIFEVSTNITASTVYVGNLQNSHANVN